MTQADLHFHLLPGVDDGPADMKETVELARMAVADGTDRVVATPHVRDIHVDELAARVLVVQEELDRRGVALRVLPGGEIAVGDAAGLEDAELEVLAQGPPEGRWVLLEAPLGGDAEALGEAAAQLGARGLGLVIAHPERSAALERDEWSLLDVLLGLGARVQLNGGSLLGRHGENARRRALDLIRSDRAHLVASDAHEASRPPCLADALAELTTVSGPELARRLVVEAPLELLELGV